MLRPSQGRGTIGHAVEAPREVRIQHHTWHHGKFKPGYSGILRLARLEKGLFGGPTGFVPCCRCCCCCFFSSIVARSLVYVYTPVQNAFRTICCCLLPWQDDTSDDSVRFACSNYRWCRERARLSVNYPYAHGALKTTQYTRLRLGRAVEKPLKVKTFRSGLHQSRKDS